jgi:hypothetical protein
MPNSLCHDFDEHENQLLNRIRIDMGNWHPTIQSNSSNNCETEFGDLLYKVCM